MGGQVSVTEYKESPDESDASAAPSGSAGDDKGSGDKVDEAITRVGSRASFTDLTAGQFGQLGDIIADATARPR